MASTISLRPSCGMMTIIRFWRIFFRSRGFLFRLVRTLERGTSQETSTVSFRDHASLAGFSNLVYLLRNVRGTVPVGPFLCLAMISSAVPLDTAFSSLL